MSHILCHDCLQLSYISSALFQKSTALLASPMFGRWNHDHMAMHHHMQPNSTAIYTAHTAVFDTILKEDKELASLKEYLIKLTYYYQIIDIESIVCQIGQEPGTVSMELGNDAISFSVVFLDKDLGKEEQSECDTITQWSAILSTKLTEAWVATILLLIPTWNYVYIGSATKYVHGLSGRSGPGLNDWIKQCGLSCTTGHFAIFLLVVFTKAIFTIWFGVLIETKLAGMTGWAGKHCRLHSLSPWDYLPGHESTYLMEDTDLSQSRPVADNRAMEN
ncbi:hypothetical protein B0H67DRAFT_597968 [Lasiosphaeris hirsuta]|uniref:Uncharacterized protein n=1 Tax=Lasiosphaeris hirsuta TaxID=260670 RepID=A0AA40AYB9_9PEZI|nr:hypothetical protein B0H67DRAFT_597968 [Lasiosphaeris hirsuta]